jgi:hypothetical protein
MAGLTKVNIKITKNMVTAFTLLLTSVNTTDIGTKDNSMDWASISYQETRNLCTDFGNGEKELSGFQKGK